MVTVNELEVSVITKVSVVAFWEFTVNDALPLCALMVTGGEEPLILALESLFCSEIARLSSPVRLSLQSRNSMEIVTALFMSDVLEERYACELSALGFPLQEEVEDGVLVVLVVVDWGIMVGRGTRVMTGKGVGIEYA